MANARLLRSSERNLHREPFLLLDVECLPPPAEMRKDRPMEDLFFADKYRLEELLRRLGEVHPRAAEVRTLQYRFLESIAKARRYGDSEAGRVERAQIVDALNQVAVDSLGMSFRDLPQQPAVEPEPPQFLLSAPFVGLRPFRSEDASLFFGRDRCLRMLVSKLLEENWPLLVVNGKSGVGKSSLLAAGLVPLLRRQGYAVAYSSLLDSPESDVIKGVRRDFPALEHAQSIPRAIDVACTANQPFVLIVDQLERCFTLAQDNEQRLGFWRGIARLVRGDTRCPVKVVLAVRADWLHAFQTVVPTPLDIPVFSFLSLITPLTVEEAGQALIGPLEYLSIAYEPGLIDKVLHDLTSSVGDVDPPQLQIVGEALYHRLRERSQDSLGEARLTLSDYESLGGARDIIRGHLVNTVRHFGPDTPTAWQLLARLVGPDNQRLSKHAEDLKGNLARQTFNRIIGNLVGARLVVHELSSADGASVYTLTHDYLVEEISQHVGLDPGLQALRMAERYLDAGLADQRTAQQSGGQELLLERERYLHVWLHRDALGVLTEGANEFLLRSALYHGEAGFTYWLARLPDSHAEVALKSTVSYCLQKDGTRRQAAHKAVKGAVHGNLLLEKHQTDLKDLLWMSFQGDDEPFQPSTAQLTGVERQESAATALWTFRKIARPSEVVGFAPVVARVWTTSHRQQIAVSIGSALLVILSVLAFWGVRQSLRGTWYPVSTLFAGPISAAALSPNASDIVYVVTPRGPVAGDAASLLRRQGAGKWEVLSRGLGVVQNTVQSLLITSTNGRTRIYVSVLGDGILRSDDNGKSWELINTGLNSYTINVLYADPQNADHIYAGSNDAKGVFESRDGGNNWQDISGDELFGASVLALAYTPDDGGALLAGTSDGRIVARKRNQAMWHLVAAYPGVGGIVCLSAESESGQFVYAGTSTGKVLVSPNGGDDWILVGGIPGVFYISSIIAVPDLPSIAYMDAWGIGGHLLWKSEDGGQSWDHVADDRFTREQLRWLLISRQQPDKLYAAGKAGLFETQDGGGSWIFHGEIGAPLARVTNIAISPFDGDSTYVAVGGAIYSTPNPKVGGWQRGAGLLATDVRDIAVDPERPGTAYAGVYLPNQWSIFATSDAGKTWAPTKPASAIPEKYLEDTMALAIAKTSGGGTILYAGTNGCGVLHTTDGGATWETWGRQDCSSPENAPKNVLDLAIYPQSPDTMYVAADSTKVYVTNDSGRSWQSYATPLTSRIRAIEVDPKIESCIYLIAGSSGFWRSDDGGETWQSYSQGLEDKPLSVMLAVPHRAETLFVASSNGEVWSTADGGQHWNPLRENLTVTDIATMAFLRDGEGVLLGGWDGMYRYDPGSMAGIGD